VLLRNFLPSQRLSSNTHKFSPKCYTNFLRNFLPSQRLSSNTHEFSPKCYTNFLRNFLPSQRLSSNTHEFSPKCYTNFLRNFLPSQRLSSNTHKFSPKCYTRMTNFIFRFASLKKVKSIFSIKVKRGDGTAYRLKKRYRNGVPARSGPTTPLLTLQFINEKTSTHHSLNSSVSVSNLMDRNAALFYLCLCVS
jgi:hypothetical protein